MKRTIIALLILAAFSISCSGMISNPATKTGDEETTEDLIRIGNPPSDPTGDTEELIRIGNPTGPVPEPTSQLVAKHLAANPVYEGSVMFTGKTENILVVKFDVTAKSAEITDTVTSEKANVGFDILDDGSIITTDEAPAFEVSATYSSSRLDVEVTHVGAKAVASAYPASNAAVSEDLYNNRGEMCMASSSKCFDTGAALGNARYFVAGFIQTTSSIACDMTVSDTCSPDGKELNEIVCNPEDAFGYSVRHVRCNCKNGKCIDKMTDTPPSYDERSEDFCKDNGAMCIIFSRGFVIKEPTIFPNASWNILAGKRPTTVNSLLLNSGVRPIKK